MLYKSIIKSKYKPVITSNLINIQTPEMAYVLGLIWADGFINKYGVGIECSEKDLSDVHSVFQKTGEWKPYNREKRSIKGFRISGKSLCLIFKNLDFCKKSKASPTKVLSKIPNNLKHYFWRGMFDGDGHVGFDQKGRYRVTLAGSYKQSWKDLSKLLSELEIKFSINRYSRLNKKSNKINSYSTITIQNINGFNKFLKYIYKDCLENLELFFGFSRKFLKFKEGLSLKEKHNFNLKKRSIAINVYDLAGNFLKSFDSIMSASRFLKIKDGSIRQFFRGEIKQSHGYIFTKI